VEIQQTFYQLPGVSTAGKWREEAPEEFEFILKVWQLITHPPKSPTYRRLKEKIPVGAENKYGFFQPTQEVLTAWKRTREIGQILSTNKFVFQSPPSFLPSLENITHLETFFQTIADNSLTYIWEPRGQWKDITVRDLCQKLNLVHGVDPFVKEPVFGKLQYYRLHGKGGYSYRYTDEDLEFLKGKCHQNMVYCLFNNIYMAEDARRFLQLVNKKL